MAEFATAAAAIGISNLALTSFKNAHDFIQDMIRAPEQVQRIGDELAALLKLLNSMLTTQHGLPIVETLSQEMDLAGVTGACAKACEELIAKLKQWMADPNKPSEKDRFLVRIHRSAIGEYRDVIRDTKATVALAEIMASRKRYTSQPYDCKH